MMHATRTTRASLAAVGAEPPAALIRAMIARALRTPSVDNTQPWRLEIDGATVNVELDMARARHGMIGGFAGLISLGAFAESLRLEASRRGYPSILVVDEARDAPSVRVTVGEGACADTDLAPELERRHTNRGPYFTAPVFANEATCIAAEGTRSAPVHVRRARREIEAVASASALAERVRFDGTDPADLFRWLRWKPLDAAATRDGLDTRLLALARHELLALRMTGSPIATWCLRRLGGGRIAGRRLRREILASGAVGAISVADLRPESFIECGRAMLRVWLRASKLGLALAPVTVGAMLPLSRRFGASFSRSDDRKLDVAEATLARAFGVDAGHSVAFLFRVGVPIETPTLRSERRPLSNFLGDPS
jgi:hypothetical protein